MEVNENQMKYEKQCTFCGKTFYTNRSKQFICGSVECKRKRLLAKMSRYRSKKRDENTFRLRKPTPASERQWDVKFSMSLDCKWSWIAVNKIGKVLMNGGFKTRTGAAFDFERATGEVVW